MEQNLRIFYCYSYKLNKFLKLLGYKCLEEAKNPNTHKKYWSFENYDDQKLGRALEYWKNIREDFNIV